jgi:malate dehydrogenase (oxaloacetate-decarboxylating)
VKHHGKRVEVAECNNSVCFPGIGLGGVLSRTKLVTDKMLVAATEALAKEAPIFKESNKGLCPDVDQARPVSVKIAAAVIRTAVEERLAQTKDIPVDNEEDLEDWIKAQMWDPVYRPYQRV